MATRSKPAAKSAAGTLTGEVTRIMRRTKNGFTATQVRERLAKAGVTDDRRKVNNALAGLRRAGRAANTDGRWI